jgi:hypothetical protein
MLTVRVCCVWIEQEPTRHRADFIFQSSSQQHLQTCYFACLGCTAGLAGYERHQGETMSVDLEVVGLMNWLACNLALM